MFGHLNNQDKKPIFFTSALEETRPSNNHHESELSWEYIYVYIVHDFILTVKAK